MSQSTRKTWISVLIAAVIIVGILAVAAIGGAAYFIHRHVETQFTGSENAAQQFQRARARFAGQQPLIEIQKGDRPVLHREVLRSSASASKLDMLRVIAYDDRAGKLVNVSIPFWLLRMMPSKNFSFLNDNGIDFDSERVHLTVDDLERRGPGLILDQADRRGSQVLVWSE
jgi:type II secretory pathway pseudopilin PulG